MFVVKRPAELRETIKVFTPGEREPGAFTARFKYLDLKERQEFVERISSEGAEFTDERIVAELMIGFEDVLDEDGKAIPFGDEAIAKLMNLPHIAKEIMRVVLERVVGGVYPRKN